MIRVIPLTKEHLKKFNLFGVDISLGFAKYAIGITRWKFGQQQDIVSSKRVNYLFDHNTENGIITHRLILWMFKIEVKGVVECEYSFT